MTQRIVLVFLLCAAAALAQQASISGQVTDSSGAALAGAKVIATNIATNVSTVATTNASGEYLFPDLEVGEYTVTVEHDGFRHYRENKVVLDTGQNFPLNVKMELGTVSETVTVSASAATLDDNNSVITQTFEPAELNDIPLGDRRTMNLINLMAGAVFIGYDAGAKPNFSLAGGRTQSQMLWIDGGSAQNMRLGVGQMDVDPPVETVEEVKILSNNYAAEYGASAGGVVLETTKSGTNAYHGSAYEFLRNDVIDAPGYFAPIVNGAKTIPELRYNIFGTTIGGPVRHNKTFFFFGYEGRRLGVGSNLTMTVPTLLQRAGDFSQTKTAAGAVIAIYDPYSTQLVNGKNTRTQFPGNVIPQSEMDPVAVKALNYWPLPNRAPTTIAGANNFEDNTIVWTNSNYYTGKVDHVFSEKDRLTGRYIFNEDIPTAHGPYGPSDAADPTSETKAKQQYVYVDEIHVLDSATVNDLRFNYGYRIAPAKTNGVGSNSVQALGLPGVSNNAFPQFVVNSGYTTIGSASQERDQFPIQNLQFVDTFSKIVGRHAFKFGFEARKSSNYETDLFTASGSFTFATTPTGNPSGGSGDGLASLLAGYPTAFAEAQTQPTNRYSWYYAGFAQDDFKVTHNLTLNLGVRWEMDTPMIDVNNRMNGFNPKAINPVSNTPGVVTFMGLNGVPSNPWGYDWKNFGPRFGFAWKPDFMSKLVVRGGYGIFYAHPFDTGQPASANLGFSTSMSLTTPDNGITPVFILKNGPPPLTSSVALNSSYGAVPYGGSPTTAVTYFDPSRVSGYSQQSNLSVQYQVSSSMIVELSALTNIGHKLPNTNLPIDQILPSVLSTGCTTQICRPYSQFSNVTILSPDIGDSRYVGGFLRLTKRFSQGLNLNASYTRATFLDNSFEAGSTVGSDTNAQAYSNQYNRRADWGPSPNDIRNRFSGSGVYELPFGPGRQWFSHGVMGNVLGAWTLGMVVTLQSGAPFTVTDNTNNCDCDSAGAQRPNILGPPQLPANKRSVNEWFNINEFGQPTIYTFGDEGRGAMRAPGLSDMDLSLSRNFLLREGMTFQFRGEAFNVTNHTNLSAPAKVFGAADFATITAAGPARILQVGMKLRF
jgi:hypothetical protein